MTENRRRMTDDRGRRKSSVFCLLPSVFCLLLLSGCDGGYCNTSLYPQGIGTVYVEMFDNQSFRRGVEYELTDALAKRIEAQTPYKIVTNRHRADTVINGQIMQAGESILTGERQIGRPLEKDVELRAVVTWKNLRTGELLIDNQNVSARASFSEWQSQSYAYGSTLAANSLAERIVEMMETEW
ncbi:MAG: LptE family protein [Sedimentisphaerales bacterium]|nr:LptE family protein [Sedimentisphaerales bacterium]